MTGVGTEAEGGFAALPNLNALWSALLVEELVRQGVGLFVVAPGSRSAPLALAVAQHPRARWVVHVDERGGAFAALGHARATGRPAALVTTSGTAVANALPAAVEAAHDGVPLLLLTADRPPELRETAANQTVVQPGLRRNASDPCCRPHLLRRFVAVRLPLLFLEDLKLMGVVQDLDHARVLERFDFRPVEAILPDARLEQPAVARQGEVVGPHLSQVRRPHGGRSVLDVSAVRCPVTEPEHVGGDGPGLCRFRR